MAGYQIEFADEEKKQKVQTYLAIRAKSESMRQDKKIAIADILYEAFKIEIERMEDLGLM